MMKAKPYVVKPNDYMPTRIYLTQISSTSSRCDLLFHGQSLAPMSIGKIHQSLKKIKEENQKQEAVLKRFTGNWPGPRGGSRNWCRSEVEVVLSVGEGKGVEDLPELSSAGSLPPPLSSGGRPLPAPTTKQPSQAQPNKHMPSTTPFLLSRRRSSDFNVMDSSMVLCSLLLSLELQLDLRMMTRGLLGVDSVFLEHSSSTPQPPSSGGQTNLSTGFFF